ncbi:MAG: hypothetical protein E7E61_07975 [Staphylococcus epidermidis]|nr:hypothetical protein [Staphylococcus epidermidis]
MFYVKQKLSLFRKLGDLNNIFTTIDLRYKLKVNDTFRLINMDTTFRYRRICCCTCINYG